MSLAGDFRGTYDVVVIGLGIMGSATVAHLAERGVRVLGVDAGPPVHGQGSSHGQTRIFRRAYWEGETFLPLLERAYVGWRDLDDDPLADGRVILAGGGLFVGSTSSRLVRGARETAAARGIRHEYLDAAEIRAAFPAFHAAEDQVGVFEPDALMLAAQTGRLAFLSRAVHAGAQLAYGRRVTSLSDHDSSVTVHEGAGAISCASAVVTSGSWAGLLLPHDLSGLLRPMRIPVFELDVDPHRVADCQPGRLPVFLLETADGSLIYGLPPSRAGGGVKVGFHNRQLSPMDPGAPRTPATDAERHEVWAAVRRLLPGLRSTGTGTACVYTMSPNDGFLIGMSRAVRHVSYASVCSGHGFKFAPAVGEALAELALDGHTSVDLSPFESHVTI
ncbi:MAG: N-methyl-L-tryptophan oxidase [Dermatophilaceae bacterium]